MVKEVLEYGVWAVLFLALALPLLTVMPRATQPWQGAVTVLWCLAASLVATRIARWLFRWDEPRQKRRRW